MFNIKLYIVLQNLISETNFIFGFIPICNETSFKYKNLCGIVSVHFLGYT